MSSRTNVLMKNNTTDYDMEETKEKRDDEEEMSLKVRKGGKMMLSRHRKMKGGKVIEEENTGDKELSGLFRDMSIS